MKLKAISIVSLGVILVALFANSPASATQKVIRVPGDHPTIQKAIDAADPGDIIQVAAGTYNENLRITKSLKVMGEGPDKTIVSKDGTVVFISAPNVEFQGFSVRDGTYGIFLWYTFNVSLRNNEMSSNRWNFGIWGVNLTDFLHNIDATNLVDEKPLYYWVNQHDKQVPSDAGYVALINSTKIVARDMILTSNEQGVLMVSTQDSIIENVTIARNDEGLDMRNSHNNTIRKNRFNSINWRAAYVESSHNNTFCENTLFNSTYGLSLKTALGNTFYYNNFYLNSAQLYMELSQNTWHNKETLRGNYWSDYTGQDENDDGVGDTFRPWQNVDSYPLMNVYDTMPPIARIREETTVYKDATVDFDARGSFDDTGLESYVWDFGDGSSGVGVKASHVYNQTGNFTVTLTVVDLAGFSDADAVKIVVVESPLSFSWLIPLITLGVTIVLIATTAAYWKLKGSKRLKSHS